jgi:hypothetical protein
MNMQTYPVTNDYVANLPPRWTLLKAEMKSKCKCLHLQAYDHMTTMDDNLEANDAHVWDDKRQMMHILRQQTPNELWCTCLRRQTPNDAHEAFTFRLHFSFKQSSSGG